ncbi:hypothetical protein [Litorihabitans aurantiacus]|uniref:Uncharacterized protein n=1 Tax=Litorihabitans aurantiacus TaxID=1930061 RepID=A0AA37UTQ5_9MICO|nr:hypothetical protein [Litorihabitans aurantiacus]GMA30327.1 hypothetical protein GCM10025875_03190 [Litorihabitans aurantiacus]
MPEQTPATEAPPPRRAVREEMEVRPPSEQSRARRRRRFQILGGVLGVAVVVLVVLLLTRPGGGEPDPTATPVPTETVTAPVPTPAAPPVERDTSTALLAALPGSVLAWSVTDQVPAEDLRGAGALEAYTLTYGDGEGSATLVVAQWRSAELAAEHLAQVPPAGETVRSEEVLVGGAPVGFVTVASDGAGEDRVAWSNGATTFELRAPQGAGASFYDAFGM